MSKSGIPAVQECIRYQQQHYARCDYREELIRMLTAHEIVFDEQYLE